VAAAAVGELLGAEPDCPGSRRPFPAGTRLQEIDLDAGTATVELSRSALPAAGAARRWPLQALVHTLTQFPTVRRVLVKVGGRAVSGPLTRDPAIPMAPIALAEPAAGALVKGDQLVVRGEASVYEGTVSLRLRDDRGQVMAQGYATAAEDAPGRGPFSAALTFTPGRPPCLDRGGLRGQRRGRQDRLLGPPPDLGGPLTSPLWTAGSPGPLGSATLPHRGTRRRRVRVRGARRWVRGARPGKSPTRRLGLRGTCASNPQPGRRCWTSPATTSTRAPEAVWTTRPPVAVRSTAVPTTGSVPMRSTRTCWPTVARRRR
jgi:hypothetical protein